MTDKPAKPTVPLPVKNLPGGGDDIYAIASAQAPFLYFEDAPFFAFVNGVGKITIEAAKLGAASEGTQGVQNNRVLVAHLVGNIIALKSLRAAIDGIILMAEPKPEGPANSN